MKCNSCGKKIEKNSNDNDVPLCMNCYIEKKRAEAIFGLF